MKKLFILFSLLFLVGCQNGEITQPYSTGEGMDEYKDNVAQSNLGKFETFIQEVKKAANTDDKDFLRNCMDLSTINSYKYIDPQLKDEDEVISYVINQLIYNFKSNPDVILIEENITLENDLYVVQTKSKYSSMSDTFTKKVFFIMDDGTWAYYNPDIPNLEQLEIISELKNYYNIQYSFDTTNNVEIILNGIPQKIYRHTGSIRLFDLRKGNNTLEIVFHSETNDELVPIGISLVTFSRDSMSMAIESDNINHFVGKVIDNQGYFPTTDLETINLGEKKTLQYNFNAD